RGLPRTYAARTCERRPEIKQLVRVESDGFADARNGRECREVISDGHETPVFKSRIVARRRLDPLVYPLIHGDEQRAMRVGNGASGRWVGAQDVGSGRSDE